MSNDDVGFRCMKIKLYIAYINFKFYHMQYLLYHLVVWIKTFNEELPIMSKWLNTKEYQDYFYKNNDSCLYPNKLETKENPIYIPLPPCVDKQSLYQIFFSS